MYNNTKLHYFLILMRADSTSLDMSEYGRTKMKKRDRSWREEAHKGA